ncbi:pantoate-beta-alanine ligase [Sporothrix stenoceras]|uniref:Pantoate--beta-alanine ligase n=1 Tax=Sporothrix stenoceras TaxID=5173 RepID=A0ABR3ZS67_9PEZI
MFRSGVTSAARAVTKSSPISVETMAAASTTGRRVPLWGTGGQDCATTPAMPNKTTVTTISAGRRSFHTTFIRSSGASAAWAATPAPSGAAAASTAESATAQEDGQDTIPGTSIRVFRTVAGLRAWRRQQLLAGRTVGLVPTMGALHEGHMDLVRAAAGDNDAVVVTIYVNPTQFGVHEDLGSYPRTWEADGKALAGVQSSLKGTAKGKIEAVFAPTTAEMYPSGPPSQEVNGHGSFVTITPVGQLLEGASRPTFFRGVATVCMKLFHIVQPETAYFGQKDVQQTVVLRRMVRDFAIPLKLVVGTTVREQPDGLALSSRNVYLGTRRRAVANVLRRSLLAAEAAAVSDPSLTHDQILAAAHRVADETLAAQKQLPPHERALFEIDYLSLSEADTMEELKGDQQVDRAKGAILSGAVRMLPVEDPQPGEDLGHSSGPLVRLIDNIIIEPKEN